jgi:hypothetical protein
MPRAGKSTETELDARLLGLDGDAGLEGCSIPFWNNENVLELIELPNSENILKAIELCALSG